MGSKDVTIETKYEANTAAYLVSIVTSLLPIEEHSRQATRCHRCLVSNLLPMSCQLAHTLQHV